MEVGYAIRTHNNCFIAGMDENYNVKKIEYYLYDFDKKESHIQKIKTVLRKYYGDFKEYQYFFVCYGASSEVHFNFQSYISLLTYNKYKSEMVNYPDFEHFTDDDFVFEIYDEKISNCYSLIESKKPQIIKGIFNTQV